MLLENFFRISSHAREEERLEEWEYVKALDARRFPLDPLVGVIRVCLCVYVSICLCWCLCKACIYHWMCHRILHHSCSILVCHRGCIFIIVRLYFISAYDYKDAHDKTPFHWLTHEHRVSVGQHAVSKRLWPYHAPHLPQVCIFILVYTHEFAVKCTYSQHVYIYIICICIHTYMYIHAYIRMCLCVCVCMICVFVCVYDICIHI